MAEGDRALYVVKVTVDEIRANPGIKNSEKQINNSVFYSTFLYLKVRQMSMGESLGIFGIWILKMTLLHIYISIYMVFFQLSNLRESPLLSMFRILPYFYDKIVFVIYHIPSIQSKILFFNCSISSDFTISIVLLFKCTMKLQKNIYFYNI